MYRSFTDADAMVYKPFEMDALIKQIHDLLALHV